MFSTYEEAYQTHLDYLRDFVKNTNGVTQGYLIYDQFGSPIHRVGRESNNPKWYRDFYKKHNRKPSKKDLEKLVEEHLENGFYDEFGYIPPLYPMTVR